MFFSGLNRKTSSRRMEKVRRLGNSCGRASRSLARVRSSECCFQSAASVSRASSRVLSDGLSDGMRERAMSSTRTWCWIWGWLSWKNVCCASQYTSFHVLGREALVKIRGSWTLSRSR